MARVTIEDCVKRIPNRFELCMIASQRVKEMYAGAPSVMDDTNSGDKPTVLSLKEIAADRLNYNILKEMLINNMRSTSYLDDAKEYILSTEDENEYKESTEVELEEGFLFSGEDDGFAQESEDEVFDDIEEDIEK
jgi:DNA-directed RNA polymerase subunit omega